MGLDVGLINLLSIALAIETFKKIEDEKLEGRLEDWKNKSNGEIKEILLSKNLPASKEHIKLAKEARKNFQNQVTRNLKGYWSKEKKESKVYHLGQNTTYFSISEVLKDLIHLPMVLRKHNLNYFLLRDCKIHSYIPKFGNILPN